MSASTPAWHQSAATARRPSSATGNPCNTSTCKPEKSPNSTTATQQWPAPCPTPDGSGAYAISQHISSNSYATALHHITGNTANQNPTGVTVTPVGVDPDTGVVTYQVNATDPDNDDIIYTATASTGTIVKNGDGTFTYTQTDPNDVITFYANDSHGGIATKTVTIAPNNAPTLKSQDSDTNQTTGVIDGLVEVEDLNNDALTYDVIQGSKGTVAVRQDGTWTYTPYAAAQHDAAAENATDEERRDTFTITVEDGNGGTLNIPISVDLVPANEAPTFDVEVSDPDEDGAITYTVTNPDDAEGDDITYTVSEPSHGSVDVFSGSYVYTPDGSYQDDEFTIYADDGHGGVTEYTATVIAPEPPEQPSHFDAPGTPLGAITLSPNKTRVYQYSYDAATDKTYLTIVDADSGDPVGEPIELQGNGQAPNSAPDLTAPAVQFTTNGKFALIRTYDSGSQKTYVTVVNNETGEVVDAPIEMDGDGLYFNGGKFQVVGNDAYLLTSSFEDPTTPAQLAIIDTDSGELVTQEPISSSGYMATESLQITTDGKVVLATYDPGADETIISVIDSETGDYVGTGPEAFTGRLGSTMTLDETNHRIFVPIADDATGSSTVYFVSTDSGQEFGTPVELDGSFWGEPVSSGGSVYYVTSTDNVDGSSTTWVTAIDGSSGVKNQLIDELAGRPINYNNLAVDNNGHVYLTTYIDDYDGQDEDGRKQTVTVVNGSAARGFC